LSGERIFGTDGVRGRAGQGWLAPEAVSALGRAIGAVLCRRLTPAARAARPRALLGHDGRHSGPELEAALGRGLAAAGFDVLSAGLVPTPALALLTRLQAFELGAMLSASHNPAADNGIKVFSSLGEKLPDEVEAEIEAAVRADGRPVTAGGAPRVDPRLERAYLEHLCAAAADLDLGGMRVAVDGANGAASRVGPQLLERLGAEVVALFAEPDGVNINRGCGSTHPGALQAEVRAHGADVGIALDGDADRCILVDERGGLVDGDPILMLLARHAMRADPWPDPRIVATVMSNRGLHRALREVGVGVVTVGVGDRRVVEALKRDSLSLGGEQSGHIVFGADNHYIGDGLYTALRVLRTVRASGASLSELAAPYRPFPQVLLNVPVALKPDLLAIPAVLEAVARVEDELGEDGRVLLRYSGTEPLARVMVEGPDADRIRAMAGEIANLIASELGAAPRSG